MSRKFLFGIILIFSVFSMSFTLVSALNMDQDLSGYWRFDGNYNDYSERTNTLTRKGQSLYFDGKDDWVDIDVQNSPDWEYTLSAWVKPKDKTSRMIFRRAHCSAFYLDDSNVRLYLKRSDHAADSVAISNQYINENQWNFIAASVKLNESTAKIFVNGAENSKTIDLDDSTDLMSGNGMEDFLGGGSDLNGCPGADYFKGWIDSFKFYERSLSFEQMRKLYRGKNLSEPKVGFWPISAGSGTTVEDYSRNNYDGEIVRGENLLDNSGFESGADNTGNMENIRTNYAGSSWVSDYSLFGNYSGRHNKTGEDDQWSAVEWDLSSLNTSTQYSFSTWYKCSGSASPDFYIEINNGTGWHQQDRTFFEYECNSRWKQISGEIGPDISSLQDVSTVRFVWDYSTQEGQMFVDNISLRRDGPEWSNQGHGGDVNSFSQGILGTESANFGFYDSYLKGSEVDLGENYSVSAWIRPEGDLVGSRNNPGNSCLHILKNGGSKGNGMYWIEPEGSDVGKFQVYCDMSTDGGGWTLIASYSDGSFFQDCSADSNVDLKYGNSCFTICSEFTDNSGDCNNATEKNIQDAELERLEDKYVIEKEYGDLESWNTSDYVSPAYNQLNFQETMFKDEYSDFISYNFSNSSTVSMNNLNYSLQSMSDFYRSANTNHLILRFSSQKSSIEPSQANDCGNLQLGIMAADNDGAGGGDTYYTTDRKYVSFSGARAGPIWDSANNGGCHFDDAGGRWTSKTLGGQKNTQSQYIAWFVREKDSMANTGVSQGSYSVSGAGQRVSGNENLIFDKNSPQRWSNVVLVQNNLKGVQKLFVNGILRDQWDKTSSVKTGELTVGKFFSGKIDELRLYNRSLSRIEASRMAFS